MRTAARGVNDVCSDPAQFPPSFASRVPAEQITEYVQIADRYLAAMVPLLPLVIEGCRVQSPELERECRQVITALAEPKPLVQGSGSLMIAGRTQQLEALALLPATLTMYAGTIAGVEQENYGAVRALTTDATVEYSAIAPRKVAVLDKAGPWEVVGRERHLGLALRAAQAGVLTDKLLQALASGQVPRRPVYPVSAFLFEALRSYFPDHTNSQYRTLFDAAEILLSLVSTDLASQCSPCFDGPELGLFVAHASESHPFQETATAQMLTEARREGDRWQPVQAGLFGGSGKRLLESLDAVWSAIMTQLHRGPF